MFVCVRVCVCHRAADYVSLICSCSPCCDVASEPKTGARTVGRMNPAELLLCGQTVWDGRWTGPAGPLCCRSVGLTAALCGCAGVCVCMCKCAVSVSGRKCVRACISARMCAGAGVSVCACRCKCAPLTRVAQPCDEPDTVEELVTDVVELVLGKQAAKQYKVPPVRCSCLEHDLSGDVWQLSLLLPVSCHC